jgi:hypothetical protein
MPRKSWLGFATSATRSPNDIGRADFIRPPRAPMVRLTSVTGPGRRCRSRLLRRLRHRLTRLSGHTTQRRLSVVGLGVQARRAGRAVHDHRGLCGGDRNRNARLARLGRVAARRSRDRGHRPSRRDGCRRGCARKGQPARSPNSDGWASSAVKPDLLLTERLSKPSAHCPQKSPRQTEDAIYFDHEGNGCCPAGQPDRQPVRC